MSNSTNPYAAPTDDRHEQLAIRPGWGKVLFSFEGRTPRRMYWATRGIAILPLLFAGILVGLFGDSTLLTLLFFPAYIVCLWIALAGSVKRWHDLNKSGWWIFIAMVPLIGGLWELVEAGCTRGTQGPNRYGREPS